MKFLDKPGIESPSKRRLITSSNNLIPGLIKRKPNLYVAIFAKKNTGKLNKQTVSRYQILIPIKLKSPRHDHLEKTWSDIMKFE